MIWINSNKEVAELGVTIIFGMITAGFSYLAYFYTKEKFRHDLLNKRWPIFKTIIEVSNIASKLTDIPLNKDDRQVTENTYKEWVDKLKPAQDKLKKINHQEVISLFGKDILEHINVVYGSLSACITTPYNYTTTTSVQSRNENITRLRKNSEHLIELFSPYMDFSQYKKQPHGLLCNCV